MTPLISPHDRRAYNRQGTNADESDPTFKRATRELDLTEARDDLQTFVFSATLSKDLQTNLKRGSWRGKKSKSAKSNTLGKFTISRPRYKSKLSLLIIDDLVRRLDFRDEKPCVIDISPEGGLVATLRESIIECLNTDKVGLIGLPRSSRILTFQ